MFGCTVIAASSSVKFRMDSTPESARTAFDTLRSMVTQASSTGTIELADSGALFSVSSALTSADTQSTRPHQDEWVSIASARTGSSHAGQDIYQSTLNAVSPGPAGRGAAARAADYSRDGGLAFAAASFDQSRVFTACVIVCVFWGGDDDNCG